MGCACGTSRRASIRSGWTAEYRIPLSQLRYGTSKDHVFGFTIDRDIYRFNERVSWPLFRQSVAGMVSQFGELGGLVDLAGAAAVRGDAVRGREELGVKS